MSAFSDRSWFILHPFCFVSSFILFFLQTSLPPFWTGSLFLTRPTAYLGAPATQFTSLVAPCCLFCQLSRETGTPHMPASLFMRSVSHCQIGRPNKDMNRKPWLLLCPVDFRWPCTTRAAPSTRGRTTCSITCTTACPSPLTRTCTCPPPSRTCWTAPDCRSPHTGSRAWSSITTESAGSCTTPGLSRLRSRSVGSLSQCSPGFWDMRLEVKILNRDS